MILQSLHQPIPCLKGRFITLLLEFTHQGLFAHCADEGTLIVATVDSTAFQLIHTLITLLLGEVGSFLAFGGKGGRCVAESLEAMGIEDGRGAHC